MAKTTFKPSPIVVPDGVSGIWAVESFTMTESESAFTRMRAAVHGNPGEYCPPGNYKRLVRRGPRDYGSTVVMSNTKMEMDTNAEFIAQAKGTILINGLGLGMVLTAILAKASVKSVTVIEFSPDVIKLVGPSFANDPRVTIIQADAFKFKPVGYWNCVWHDIWDTVCGDNLAEMKQLSKKYAKLCDWQSCWCEMECWRLAHY